MSKEDALELRVRLLKLYLIPNLK